MELDKIALDLRNVLQEKREELKLTFVEKNHKYFMIDKNGVMRNDYYSITSFCKIFHEEFDSKGKSFEMAKGDVKRQNEILKEWKKAGDTSINVGSRTHYLLEEYMVDLYGSFKDLRLPEFSCNELETIKSDKMVNAGKQYVDLMHDRGLVLLDTEMVLGDNEDELVGQSDKIWLGMNKEKTDFGFIVTDWKTGKPKNFEVQSYTKKMYPPFEFYPDTSLTHYNVQLPFYGRLMKKMLKGTKYENINFLGCVVVLLKEDETFIEYRTPKEMINIVMDLNIKNYV